MKASVLKMSAAFVLIAVVSVPGYAETTPTAQKLDKAQCETLWNQALSGSTGDLAMDKASPFVKDFTKADTNNDKKLSSTEWTAACNEGWVHTASTDSNPQKPETSSGTTSGATSDRTPGGASERTPGASSTGAAGTDKGQTTGGTSDRTPSKN
jgi:hypothetical protein